MELWVSVPGDSWEAVWEAGWCRGKRALQEGWGAALSSAFESWLVTQCLPDTSSITPGPCTKAEETRGRPGTPAPPAEGSLFSATPDASGACVVTKVQAGGTRGK